MKFYSEVTNQLYDTMEQLKEEESIFLANDVAQPEPEQPAQQEPTRKQLAAEVEAAENRVREAQANMEVAKQSAKELSQKYLQELDAIMNPAKEELKAAQEAHYTAVHKFNAAYGPYTTTYTGARAADEFARVLSSLSSLPGLFGFRF